MNPLILLVLLFLLIWAMERFYLRGGGANEFPAPTDSSIEQKFSSGKIPGPQQDAVVQLVKKLIIQITDALNSHRLREARAVFDSISDNREYVSTFSHVDADGVPAEWVTAPGSDPGRRVLYIHGGGFVMGGPKSHRTITSKFSEVSGCSVLAIDYRLMPESQHRDCVEDCRTAFRWILKNGPDGPGKIRQLFVGGDSAGGNLSLSLAAWIRDNGLHAPDALVVMSPLTDVTFQGASVRKNQQTDVMLKPVMGKLNKLPQFIKSWWVVWTYRVRPANPLVSPLLGDLSDLPPTLIQASEAEMLLDDARRYVAKAQAAGSPVELQTWPHMVHVWHIFSPELPEAEDAFENIGEFLQSVEQGGSQKVAA